MSRAAAAASLALVLMTAACAPEGVSAAEAGQWLQERQADMPSDALAAAGGPVSREDPEPAPEDGITMAFANPADVTEIRLECLGEGTVSFTVHVTMVDQTVGQTYWDRECGADGHGSLYGPDVVSVRVNGFGADRDGAWHAVVLGTEG